MNQRAAIKLWQTMGSRALKRTKVLVITYIFPTTKDVRLFRGVSFKPRRGGLFIGRGRHRHSFLLFFGGAGMRETVQTRRRAWSCHCASNPPEPRRRKTKRNYCLERSFYKQATPTGFERRARLQEYVSCSQGCPSEMRVVTRTKVRAPAHARPAGAQARNRIPKGFRLKAQGCEERATLGKI